MHTPTVVCDVCKQPSTIISGDIRKEDVCFGTIKAVLTFYKCPSCYKEYVVQVDNTRIKSLMEEYVGLAVKSMSYNGPSKQIKDKLDHINGEVERLRKELATKYDGKKYIGSALEERTLDFHNIAQVY